MKRLLISIVCALSVTFLNAQQIVEPTKYEKLNLKPIESVDDEQSRKMDKERQFIRVHRNEHFKMEDGKVGETGEIAVSYLQAKRDVFGLSHNPGDIQMTGIVPSPAGKYVYFRQYVHDIPVYATNFIVFVNNDNVVVYALNEFRDVAKYKDMKSSPSLNNSAALAAAYQYLDLPEKDTKVNPKTELVYFESMDKGLELAWKINIMSGKTMENWQIFMSSENGRIIHAQNMVMNAKPKTGSGWVFNPNPLVSAGVPYGHDSCYMHNSGANNPCLENELIEIPLNDLTFEKGLYKLKGPYCEIKSIDELIELYGEDEELTGYKIPELRAPKFHFTRDQPEFEAVMCYYHVDLSARRLLELGHDMPEGLKKLWIFPIAQFGLFSFRNALYDDVSNLIWFGSSPNNAYVNAAQDADVIWHEHAHAIQFNFTPGGMIYSTLSGSGSLLEGSADYWATSFKRSLYLNNDWEAMALWFDMDDPAIDRRTDRDWRYPLSGSSHYVGQIWSSALMKIWGDLGRDITDRLYLESHLIWGQEPSMLDGAAAFLQADVHLYDGAHLCQILSRFSEHGLTDYYVTSNFANRTVTQDATIYSCDSLTVENVTISSGVNVVFEAQEKVVINPNFHAPLGSYVKIKTAPSGVANSSAGSSPQTKKASLEEAQTQEIDGIVPENEVPENEDQIFSFFIYPNPTNGFVTVDYTLHADAPICMELYNIYGQRIKLIVPQQHQASGQYSVQISVASLRTGTYFVRMISGNQIESKQLIINH